MTSSAAKPCGLGGRIFPKICFLLLLLASARSAIGQEAAEPPVSDPDALAAPAPTDDADALEDEEPVEDMVSDEGEPAEEDVSASTEAVLWMQDDLRQSLKRVGALQTTQAPVWPTRRFDRVDVEGGAGSDSDFLYGMKGAQDAAIRMRALEALGASGGGNDDLDACLASLLDPVEAVRQAAADAVAELCQRPGNAPLAEQLLLRVFEVYSKWGLRERTAVDAALPRWAEILCTPALRGFESEETSKEHRTIAAYCLGRMRCLDAADALATLAQSEEENLAREAAGALYRLRDPESSRVWVGLLQHEDLVVQRLAVEALAALGDTVALDAITPIALGETNHGATMQVLAVNALALWPRDAAIPRLIATMERNATARQYAVARLRQITRLPLDDSPAEWKAWYETGALPAGVAPPASRNLVEFEGL